jgi:hypothetical protein
VFFFETAIICFIGIETSAEQGRVCRHRSALVVEGVWRCQLVAMDERVATVYVHCLCGNTPTLILSCRLLVTVSMVWGVIIEAQLVRICRAVSVAHRLRLPSVAPLQMMGIRCRQGNPCLLRMR